LHSARANKNWEKMGAVVQPESKLRSPPLYAARPKRKLFLMKINFTPNTLHAAKKNRKPSEKNGGCTVRLEV